MLPGTTGHWGSPTGSPQPLPNSWFVFVHAIVTVTFKYDHQFVIKILTSFGQAAKLAGMELIELRGPSSSNSRYEY
jgi:hypothetical protein